MTRNWNDLPNELKWMIVDRMDIITRFRLKMCSKSDKCLVESIPFYCDSVMIGDMNPVGVPLLNFVTSHFDVRWNDATSSISIKRGNKERFIRLSSEEESHEMIRCMFRAFMLPQNARIGYFFTSLNLNYLFPPPDFKLHAKKLSLRVENREENEKWINILVNQPEELDIFNECNGIGAHPVVKGGNILLIWENNDIDDDQLMTFQAKKMRLGVSLVTENGVNKLAKKMIDEDYPIRSKMLLFCSNATNWDRVIEGFDVEPLNFGSNIGKKVRVNMSAGKDLIIFYTTHPIIGSAHILVVVPKLNLPIVVE